MVWHHTEKAKEKISLSNKGKKHSEITKKKRVILTKESKKTNERSRHISEGRKGIVFT